MENKYKKWYYNIISKAHNRITTGYTETHHIVPRSLGGTDIPENLIQLTAREHFICHILLTKFTTGRDRIKMVRAAIMMKSSNEKQRRYFNSRLYEAVRIEFSKQQSLAMKGENNPYFGKKHSTEIRQKMSESKKGKSNNSWNTGLTKDTSEKLKEVGANISKAKKGVPSSKKGKPGKPVSEETKTKMRQSLQGKSYWWNNGITNIRAATSPDESWRRGRLMPPSFYDYLSKKRETKTIELNPKPRKNST